MNLNKRYNPYYSPNEKELEIILATTNDIVRQTNQKELKKLIGDDFRIDASVTGIFLNETNESKLPADKILNLKEGSQVMFIKNDPDRRWVNGSLGRIITINTNCLRVKLNSNNQVYDVQKVTWESYEYIWNKEEEKIEKKINGTFTQFPIKLAWAVTIHKSQGQSFDKVVIDLGRGAFATGQTYVALSRCRSFNGITLKTPINSKDIKVDEKVKIFLNSKNTILMERERFESIIRGMQSTLDKLEPQNLELIEKIKQLDSKVSNLVQLNQAKENIITALNKENAKLKSELSKLKNRFKMQSIFFYGLIAIFLYFTYRFFIQ